MSSSGRRPKTAHTFPTREIDVEAAALMSALCKPWELGGHPHDFYVATRSARVTDGAEYYERGIESLKKHERMVSEKIVWSRQRLIKEEMMQLLSRLHSIERQRRHFSAVRARTREPSPMFYSRPQSSARSGHESHRHINTDMQLISTSFVNNVVPEFKIHLIPQYKDSYPLENTVKALEKNANVAKQPALSPVKLAERKEVQDLDAFDAILQPTPVVKGKKDAGAKAKKK